jgi:thiamine-triphosphatase
MTFLKLAMSNTKVYQRKPPRIPKPGLTFEVERKFSPTPASLSRLLKNDGSYPFLSHNYLSRKVLKDIYFEIDGVDLTEEGLYIRARNGVLKAKVRQAGDRGNNVSQVTIGKVAIKNSLFSTFPKMSKTKINIGNLSPFGWMRTLRDEWRVDEFNVAIDRTLFGLWISGEVEYPQRPHLLGEIELCQSVGKEDKEEAAQEMDQSIKIFMENYELAFPRSDEEPKGKLVAFDEWMKDDESLWEPRCNAIRHLIRS